MTDDLRYPSDLTGAERAILKPLFLPPSRPVASAVGRCAIIDAIFFVLRGGCLWRMLPEHFPPHRTTDAWCARLRDDGIWRTVNHHLLMLDRERVGREATPSTAVTAKASRPPKQAVHVAMTRPRRSEGASDTPSSTPTARYCRCKSAPPMCGIATAWCRCYGHPAAGSPSSSGCLPTRPMQGERVANATRIVVEIVRKLPDQPGFTVVPRR